MKKLLIIVSMFFALNAVASDPPKVNDKVLKAFKETFLNAKNVIWHEYTNSNSFEANFKQSDIQVRARFDEEGNLLTTIRYYQEEHLPAHILNKLNKNKRYRGMSVFGVTETTKGVDVRYHISLQDDENWYFVESDSWAELTLVDKYKKA